MRLTISRLATIAVGACALLAPPTASATSTPEQIATAKSKGVTYLKSLQKESGEIPGFGGDWSLTSLAAAGVAAADVKKTEISTDARTWYQGVVGAVSWPGTENPPATDFERAALISYAAGIDPARVSKRQNLIAKVASYYQTASPGYYGSTFNGTVFGLLALADTKTTTGAQRVPQVVLDEAIEAVRANQHSDGGWTWAKAAGSEEALAKESEPDMTGAAMAALCTSGVANTDEAIVEAKEFLASKLVVASGAFESEFGVNTDSNAWAVEGLKACGIDSQKIPFLTEGLEKTPIDFLISQQVASGGFRYSTSGSTAEEYASQDAVRALGEGGFTAVPPVPSSAPQWKAETEFSIGKTETAPLALIVDNGSSLKVCSVSLAPEATTTTLAKVLDAAVTATVPTGCVTSYAPNTGKSGAITQINGYPSPAKAEWNISIDGAEEVQATRTTTIHLGDTIYLKFG
jgi:hypothetical protein